MTQQWLEQTVWAGKSLLYCSVRCVWVLQLLASTTHRRQITQSARWNVKLQYFPSAFRKQSMPRPPRTMSVIEVDHRKNIRLGESLSHTKRLSTTPPPKRCNGKTCDPTVGFQAPHIYNTILYYLFVVNQKPGTIVKDKAVGHKERKWERIKENVFFFFFERL